MASHQQIQLTKGKNPPSSRVILFLPLKFNLLEAPIKINIKKKFLTFKSCINNVLMTLKAVINCWFKNPVK